MSKNQAVLMILLVFVKPMSLHFCLQNGFNPCPGFVLVWHGHVANEWTQEGEGASGRQEQHVLTHTARHLNFIMECDEKNMCEIFRFLYKFY
jgi:hypothetical protein